MTTSALSAQPGRPLPNMPHVPPGPGSCAEVHPWPTPGEVVTRTWFRAGDGARWLTIEHADPQIVISERVLAELRHHRFPRSGINPYTRLTMPERANPLPPAGKIVPLGEPPDPYMPMIREPSTQRLRPDEWTGARLRVEAANLTVVYVITSYLGDHMWLGTWPD
jgi:hypothetical protein